MIANHPQIVILRNINLFLPLLFSPFLISTLSSRRAFHCSERWEVGAVPDGGALPCSMPLSVTRSITPSLPPPSVFFSFTAPLVRNPLPPNKYGWRDTDAMPHWPSRSSQFSAFRYRFSALWLRSKCSICSYRINLRYLPNWGE